MLNRVPPCRLWSFVSSSPRARVVRAGVRAPSNIPEDQFFLQWTIIMGSHVHSFRDR